ncbi:MAG: AAA family ATPase, partial [Clostridia bacterium]|nr:AAA family ATPase [Clostridia bacterium]
KDLEELTRQLQADDLTPAETVITEKPKAHGSGEKNIDVNKAFSEVSAKLGEEVIGQDEFLKKLILSFKRPFVMGMEESKPASLVVISGKQGTGRHLALTEVVKEMHTSGLIGSDKISVIDLSYYPENTDTKLLIQDLFSAFQTDSKVILFENYDKCSKSVLNMVAELCKNGNIRLSSRYAMQKGMLVDVGNALVPNAISSLSAEGRYLFFMTENSPAKLQDAMGAAFVNAVADICTTSEFAPESLTKIGKKEFTKLSKKVEEKLKYKLIPSDEVYVYFAGKFSKTSGVNTISDFAEKCFRVLSEHKLFEGTEEMSFDVKAEDNNLVFVSGETKLYAEEKVASESDALQAVRAEMDSIVGLKTVKEYIFSLEEHYKVAQMRKDKGMKASSPSMHMIFTGNPGTGKTTIARIVSRYLKAIGVLTGGQLIEVTRADLVGRYVGHTAPLTRQVIESAIGGVLFIDEAYSLYRGQDDSFGLEAIDTLVKGMEDNRENLLVILAGYSNEMEEFLTANSGLRSRFPNIIEFPDYTADELLEISKLTVKSKGYKLAEECFEPLRSYYDMKQKQNATENGNGRMARNLIEAAILNQSKRIIAEKSENLEELILKDFDLL